MRNPRILITDETWAQVRSRAAGTNTTTSRVVEDALTTYLDNRGSGMTQGSVIPEFTSDVTTTYTTGVVATNRGDQDATLLPVTNVTSPVTGYRKVRPVPKPASKAKGRARYEGDSW